MKNRMLIPIFTTAIDRCFSQITRIARIFLIDVSQYMQVKNMQ